MVDAAAAGSSHLPHLWICSFRAWSQWVVKQMRMRKVDVLHEAGSMHACCSCSPHLSHRQAFRQAAEEEQIVGSSSVQPFM